MEIERIGRGEELGEGQACLCMVIEILGDNARANTILEELERTLNKERAIIAYQSFSGLLAGGFVEGHMTPPYDRRFIMRYFLTEKGKKSLEQWRRKRH